MEKANEKGEKKNLDSAKTKAAEKEKAAEQRLLERLTEEVA